MAGYLILDAAGKVIGTHSWGGLDVNPCPLQPPEGGQAMLLKDNSDVEWISSWILSGQTVVVVHDKVTLDGEPYGAITDGKFYRAKK